MARRCDTCEDRLGFYVRPCPGCGQHRPTNAQMALIYGVPAGTVLTGEHLLAFRQRQAARREAERERSQASRSQFSEAVRLIRDTG